MRRKTTKAQAVRAPEVDGIRYRKDGSILSAEIRITLRPQHSRTLAEYERATRQP